jgi:hypothetical protein
MARFRGFRKLLILAASALAVFGLIAELAVADELTDQERFIQLINQERAAHGLPSLGINGSLVDVARAHSARMASAGTIFHNSNLANEVAGGWTMLGENVGVGGSVEALDQAFINSGSHRANVLGPFDRAGIGVVMSGSTIYVTEVFWQSAYYSSTAGAIFRIADFSSPNWESLGGVLASGPDVSSWAPERLDVFVHGTDNQLWHRWYDGTWSPGYEPLGGVLTAGPGAVSWSQGRIDVFVRGGDNQLWHLWYDGSWSAWEPLGGVLASGPDVSSWAPGRLDVFVQGTDNQLWHKWWDGTSWSHWEPLGGVLTAGPGAVSWSDGRIDVFVRGGDNQLWHRWYDGAWSHWEPLGGVLASGPDVSSWAPGRLDVFAQGTDDQLWHKWWDGTSWSHWEPFGGILASGPGAVSWGMERIDVFVQGLNNALWHRWFD